ncbi:Kinesin-like protein KIF13A [Trichinella nativa]|uniref:Kinesin-like protein KIF13A n=1 Tax=Trichinella nativa TaxID=6335 RepID=A0A0V1LLF3_9BILA|nr:Kinesin-like protein KIF13A [Trichinella nativa]
MAEDKLKVFVRVRPLSKKEALLNTHCIVSVDDCRINIRRSTNNGKTSTFTYDNCFWSFRNTDKEYKSQEDVFNDIGHDLLDDVFMGYNACIFAYGQTEVLRKYFKHTVYIKGSGKSYTMMGSKEQPGLIPRLCIELFRRIDEHRQDVTFKVEVSYFEIYNEKVRDLLDPNSTKSNLKVREHAILGPYVDGLSNLAVSSKAQFLALIEEGNKLRTVAATSINAESSRSHANICIRVTQSKLDKVKNVVTEKASKISLVDLAGSESARKSGAKGERLKEGSNINKSLTTLGLVISALAETSRSKKSIKTKFVPYRDSVLTWLLKDCLGGNSRTVMIATVSPSSDSYEETMSTLRFADRAKRIVNHPVVNEDPNAKLVRQLKEEVALLRSKLCRLGVNEDVQEKLEAAEKMMRQMNRSWEERLRETERIYQERQNAFEKMGVSVQASGIRVQTDKFYLVNLNADPSMNELLIYYLKKSNIIGLPGGAADPDIQLQGIGIMPRHAVIDIEQELLYIQPMYGARTCVNGCEIFSKTQLHHGDRLLLGHNHFFRVNCPSIIGSIQKDKDASAVFDYGFAEEEVMYKELRDTPLAIALSKLERHHLKDKQVALENQRRIYEEQLQSLRNQCISPLTPCCESNCLLLTPCTPSLPNSYVKSRYTEWATGREDVFRMSMAKLKENLIGVNKLVREANLLASMLHKETKFNVTLQIPAENLNPRKICQSTFICEPAVLVQQGKRNQIWAVEKLENKLIVMRDLYNQNATNKNAKEAVFNEKFANPFFDSFDTQYLIGVANVFLEVLFHDVKLNYHVPIISQQGEVSGRLHIELYRLKIEDVTDPEKIISSSFDETSAGFKSVLDLNKNPMNAFLGRKIIFRLIIKKVCGLPEALSNFVFCQYRFGQESEATTVTPAFNPEKMPLNTVYRPQAMVFQFDHQRDVQFIVNEEMYEYLVEGALSVQVYGHRSSTLPNTQIPIDVMECRRKNMDKLKTRWAEVMRRIQFWIEIHELNEQGIYTPVPVTKCSDCSTGGVYNIRPGQQRRLLIRLSPVSNCGLLPLIMQTVSSVSIGSVCVCNDPALDSYQECDLVELRQRWLAALEQRRDYLNEQINLLANQQFKSDADKEREKSLIDQWLFLTEERNAVCAPEPNTFMPGAPAEGGSVPFGFEDHIPVIFLDLLQNTPSVVVPGAKSVLSMEHDTLMVQLPILSSEELANEITTFASWDSSVHDCVNLNRLSTNEHIYAIVRVQVLISHPTVMNVILRKRICLSLSRPPSLPGRWLRKFHAQGVCHGTGLYYDVVAHLPRGSCSAEANASLALVAARNDDHLLDNGNSYIEKYTTGILEVESLLALDRLRQEVAIREILKQTDHRKMQYSNVISPTLKNTDNVVSSASIGDKRLFSNNPARPTFLNLKPFYTGRLSKIGSPSNHLCSLLEVEKDHDSVSPDDLKPRNFYNQYNLENRCNSLESSACSAAESTTSSGYESTFYSY